MPKEVIISEERNENLFIKISALIEQSKNTTIKQVNSSISQLFWHIGSLIKKNILLDKRAEYGQRIVVTLSRQLVLKYGKNFEVRNLHRMIQFYEQFQNYEIVVTLSPHLSWSHFIILLTIKKEEARVYYADKIATEIWSVRELRKQILNKSFERAIIANTQLSTQIQGTKNVFKDPYFLDFLGLNDDYFEIDLENVILKELEKFILELGKGFTFVERQKRMIIDGEDFNLDLLFYHRKLKRLVAIELKIGKFKAQYKGQMELYLKWLNKYEKQEGEETPIGLVLCTEASKEQIELLEMEKDGIMVAEYWTELPPKNILEEKIQQAVFEAKERIERRKLI